MTAQRPAFRQDGFCIRDVNPTRAVPMRDERQYSQRPLSGHTKLNRSSLVESGLREMFGSLDSRHASASPGKWGVASKC